MLTYKIFLNTDMTIKDVISSGNLVQYSWNNISLNVYIPKAIYETTPSISNAVSITFAQTKENGETVITNHARLYEFSYVKDNVIVGNIEYVLLTRQMPQQMTLYFGNTQMFQINHLVISDNEIISFAQSPFQRYEVFQASNTQEIHDEPSTVDELQADINNLKRRTEQLEARKQDKANSEIHVRTVSAVSDNPNYFTPNVTVGLNILSTRTDDLEVDNKKNKEDIADLKATMTTQFTPLGKLEGNTAEPTLAQINAWLSAQGITQLELGYLITYVGHVTGAVDTNYNCLYTHNGWIWYETTSLELASNTEKGIVKGNGNNTNANEVIDIQSGEIQGIKVKDMNGTQRYLKGYINDLEDKQTKILNGTTSVPKATNSQNDGLGNNIQATYQTKVIGASKQYVKDYALAKMFNELNYINYDSSHTDIGHSFVGGNIQKTISTIGDVKLFNAYYKTTAYEYELSQNNVFSISLPIMLNVSKTAKIKVVVKCDNNATDATDTPFVIGTAESDNISFVANQVSIGAIQGTFTSLTQPITITPEKQLVVEVYIFNTDSQSFEVNIYNTLSQPSTFTLTIPYQTIQIVQDGAIGQQYLHNVCNYNATATSSLGVGYVFDIDSELVNNTEHKFIARVTDIDQHIEYTYIRVAKEGVEIPVIATFEEGEEQQPYYEPWHRKFLYVIDDNTAVIMFSAFYTNGQFIIVEPNDVDYAKQLDFENIFENIMDGTSPVGKAKADQLGNVINTTYATKNEFTNLSNDVDSRLNQQDAVIQGLGNLKLSGVDTSTNILAFTEDKGIYVGTDTGHWYYWNGAQYVDGGLYQATEIAEKSINIEKLSFYKQSNNIFNKDSVINGFHIFCGNGVVTPNADWCATDFIEINGQSKLYFSPAMSQFCFYDAAKNAITSTHNDTIYDINIPTNAKYVRLSCVIGRKNIQQVSFYPILNKNIYKNGLIIPSKYLENEREKVYIGANEEFTTIMDGFNYAYSKGSCDVYICEGVYEIPQSVIESYYLGIDIGNNNRYYFSSKAKIIANYQGTNVDVQSEFSIFYNEGGNFEMYNLTAEASNIRYIIHDECGGSYLENTSAYTHKYINCNMTLDNTNALTTDYYHCIGGGLGKNGEIVIENCYFNSVKVDSNNQSDVSYHGNWDNTRTDGHAKIFITNSYFEHTLALSSPNTETQKKYVLFTGNSIKSDIILNSTTTDYWDIKKWNNDIRN